MKAIKDKFTKRRSMEVQIIRRNIESMNKNYMAAILKHSLNILDDMQVKYIATMDNDEIVIRAVDKYGVPLEGEIRITDPSFFEEFYKLN